MITRKLDLVAIGGTFDRLHRGHIALLSKAFMVGKKVVIGVSSDPFVQTMHKKHEVQPYEDRVLGIKKFLCKNQFEDRAIFVPLDDPYGPTVTDADIEGIVVSRETHGTAKEINKLRRTRGLRPLRIFTVDLVLAQDGKPISSTRIRLREIDQEGIIAEKRATN